MSQITFKIAFFIYDKCVRLRFYCLGWTQLNDWPDVALGRAGGPHSDTDRCLHSVQCAQSALRVTSNLICLNIKPLQSMQTIVFICSMPWSDGMEMVWPWTRWSQSWLAFTSDPLWMPFSQRYYRWLNINYIFTRIVTLIIINNRCDGQPEWRGGDLEEANGCAA